MKAFLGILAAVFALAGVGEYFYFIGQVNRLQDKVTQQQSIIDTAKQEAITARTELQTMQKDAKTREALSKELLACQQGTFEKEYETWPAFLRPNASGEVEPVKKWILSGVADLNSIAVVSYDPPVFDGKNKVWKFDVRMFGKRLNDEYGVNIVHFKFFQDSRLNEAKEEPEW